MDASEARLLLRQHMAHCRERTHAELAAAMGRIDIAEVRGGSGAIYQIEIQVLWDDKEQRNLRVLGAIDDGGVSAFRPLNEDFIMAPDGSVLGE
jgi:hypothetical protein